VFEVVPATKPAPTAVVAPTRHEPRGDWPPPLPAGSFVPPELAAAAVQAKAKQAAQVALAVLNPTDQYLVLVALLADLHAKFGGDVPRSAQVTVEVPRSERKPTSLSQPPPPAPGATQDAEEEEVEEPKPRAAPRSKASRPKATAAKSRSRA
jgi:hypothetical protein